MKKTFLFSLIMIFTFVLVACNTTVEADPNGSGSGDDVIYDWGNPGYKNPAVLSTDNAYPGYELALSGCPNIQGVLGDISGYGAVILDAILYDRAGNPIPEGTSSSDMEAQFHILTDGSSGWDEANKLVTKYDINISGETSAAVNSSAAGKPGKLLVQAHYTSGVTLQVGYIEVRKLTFKAKSGNVVLGVIFGGSYVEVAGNKITFTNAENSSGAAYYDFPSKVLPLRNKTITVSYTLAAGFTKTMDHQLIIQAANGDSNVNYDGSAQQYKDLNDPVGKAEAVPPVLPDEPEPDGTFSGTFTIDGTALEDAAAAKSFTLTRIRIVNNGGTTNESGVVREKSYSVTFHSITVEPTAGP